MGPFERTLASRRSGAARAEWVLSVNRSRPDPALVIASLVPTLDVESLEIAMHALVMRCSHDGVLRLQLAPKTELRFEVIELRSTAPEPALDALDALRDHVAEALARTEGALLRHRPHGPSRRRLGLPPRTRPRRRGC